MSIALWILVIGMTVALRHIDLRYLLCVSWILLFFSLSFIRALWDRSAPLACPSFLDHEYGTDRILHRPKRQGFKPSYDDAESPSPEEEDDMQKKAVDADVVVETLPVNRP